MKKRFLRKANNKVIGGVCSGLSDYIGVELTIVRLLTLVAIIASGFFPGLFLYLLCVIIVPQDTQVYQDPRYEDPGYSQSYTEDDHYSDDREYSASRDTGNSRMVLGSLLIAAGIFLFARMFLGWLDWRYIFAGFLVIGGLYMLFGSRRS